MALSYYFNFKASATASAAELETFLKHTERYAKSLGFGPSTVLNVPFDTQARRDFAFRLSGGIYVESEKLKGFALPSPEDAANHNQEGGSCRLMPRQGVVLIVTDEKGCETCFGFMKYPAMIRDINGRPIVESGTGDAWTFRNYVDTADKRYRKIVKKFADAGYLESQKDEYTARPAARADRK